MIVTKTTTICDSCGRSTQEAPDTWGGQGGRHTCPLCLHKQETAFNWVKTGTREQVRKLPFPDENETVATYTPGYGIRLAVYLRDGHLWSMSGLTVGGDDVPYWC